ncbi:MAG TPA: N,N-dimethylformamidase beta subunit family domain-containing protein [Solirubrobacteraceae bacterium]
MSRLAAGAFAALVVATFGAFFVAQRLKNSPPVLSEIGVPPFFSPNGDGRFDVARVTFRPKETDTVSVAVLDGAGDEVRELVGSRHVRAGELVRLKWDGRTDAGTRARDGRYRYRITLSHAGRSVKTNSVRLDTTPPRARVTTIGPRHEFGPELMPRPDGGDAVVHFQPGRHPVIRLFKTAPGPARLVLQDDTLRDGAKEWRWNGLTPSGRPVSPGTYLVAIETRDQAGNRGLAPPLDRRGLPVVTYGGTLPGHGGITVRYLGVRPPATAARVGEEVEFFVDARQKPWTWSVRRVGTSEATPPRRKTSARVRLHAPGRESGVYLMQVRTATRTTSVPFAVQSHEHHAVLLVLPVMTWQGRNPLDDDGDGLPNLLDRGVGAALNRIYAGDGLPAGFATRDAPLLQWLDRNHHRYDITTDAALALGRGPRLEGHAGVILPSDVRWLPRALQQRLRRYVRNGGKVASFGVDSLMRQVSISRNGRLVDPTPRATTDLFGARLRATETLSAPTNVVNKNDDIDFFAGTSGTFGPFATIQEADSLGAEPVASAVTVEPPASLPVIAASRLGKGLVIRYPVPELPARAASGDLETSALLDRTWTLLSR